MIREVPKVQIQQVEKIAEMPQIQIVEKIVEVPQVHILEVIRARRCP